MALHTRIVLDSNDVGMTHPLVQLSTERKSKPKEEGEYDSKADPNGACNDLTRREFEGADEDNEPLGSMTRGRGVSDSGVEAIL